MMTRDSPLWNILMVVGMTIGGALIASNNPADYGMGPVTFKWVQLLALGLTAVGKLGNSPLQSKQEARAEDRLEARQDARDERG
jgi:hypothetical protein